MIRVPHSMSANVQTASLNIGSMVTAIAISVRTMIADTIKKDQTSLPVILAGGRSFSDRIGRMGIGAFCLGGTVTDHLEWRGSANYRMSMSSSSKMSVASGGMSLPAS